MKEELEQSSCGVALEGRLGHAYNEEAFRYFLEIERKRATRLRRSCVLLLVGLKGQPQSPARIDPVLAAKLFSSLWFCLRETDVTGWYREDRVAGALLSQLADTPETETIRERVTAALYHDLRPNITHRLLVHVYQLRPRPQSGSSSYENRSIVNDPQR
jgi:hypothetical protein